MAISLKSSARFPVCNPFRFIRQYSVSQGERKNFDDVEFEGIQHGDVFVSQGYGQEWLPTDTPIVKFLSSFASHSIELIRKIDDVVVATPVVSLDKKYTGLDFYSTCKCKEKNGKIFVYWENEIAYEDAYITPDYTFNARGRLPNNENGILLNFQAGDVVSVKPDVLTGFQVGTVSNLAYDDTVDAYGLLTDISIGSLSSTDGQVQVTYNQKKWDLYTFPVSFSGLEGEYYMKATLTTGSNTVVYVTETLTVSDDDDYVPKQVKLRYKHIGTKNTPDYFDFEYDDFNIIRLSSSAFHVFTPSGEIETFDSDTGVVEHERAVPQRRLTLTAVDLPNWLLDKLNVIFAHDTLEVNGYEYKTEDYGDVDKIEGNDTQNFEVTLVQVTDRISNESPEFTESLDAFFTPSTSSTAVAGGESQNTTLTDETGTTFELESKPSWITLDKSTLTDQEVLQVTFSENTNPTERTGTVVFRSQTYPALKAEFDVIQDGTGGVGDFIEAFSEGVDATLGIQFDKDGETIDINVNSSSTWQQGASTSIPSGWTVNVISQTLIRITATQNTNVVSGKNGNLDLELVSNPGVNLSIPLSQISQDGIQEVDPSGVTISNSAQAINLTLNADAGCNWQVINASMSPWILSIVPNNGNGSASVTINVSENTTGFQRFGTVVFQNTDIPSNGLNFNITQNG